MISPINGIQELRRNLLPVIPDRPEVQVPLEFPVCFPSHFLGIGLPFLLSGTSQGQDPFCFSSSFSFWVVLSPHLEFRMDLLPVWALRLPLALLRNCPARSVIWNLRIGNLFLCFILAFLLFSFSLEAPPARLRLGVP